MLQQFNSIVRVFLVFFLKICFYIPFRYLRWESYMQFYRTMLFYCWISHVLSIYIVMSYVACSSSTIIFGIYERWPEFPFEAFFSSQSTLSSHFPITNQIYIHIHIYILEYKVLIEIYICKHCNKMWVKKCNMILNKNVPDLKIRLEQNKKKWIPFILLYWEDLFYSY